MSNVSLKKRLIPWLPYVLIGLFATNLAKPGGWQPVRTPLKSCWD